MFGVSWVSPHFYYLTCDVLKSYLLVLFYFVTLIVHKNMLQELSLDLETKQNGIMNWNLYALVGYITHDPVRENLSSLGGKAYLSTL